MKMTKREKVKIANCLVRAIKTKEAVDKETHDFLANWIYKGIDNRRAECLEVWEMVLDKYRPEETPVLYRATDYINDGKIESYTGRLGAAERFLANYGIGTKLIICNTENYSMSFYPLSQLLRNELRLEESLFNKWILFQYIGEDEYIMRTDAQCITVYEQVA